MTVWAVRLWGRNCSVPCFLSVANSFGLPQDLDPDGNLVSVGVERRFVSQDAPRHARQLVRQGDCKLVTVHPFCGSSQPVAKAEVRPSVGTHQDDLGGLNEQHSQVSTPSFGDAP